MLWFGPAKLPTADYNMAPDSVETGYIMLSGYDNCRINADKSFIVAVEKTLHCW